MTLTDHSLGTKDTAKAWTELPGEGVGAAEGGGGNGRPGGPLSERGRGSRHLVGQKGRGATKEDQGAALPLLLAHHGKQAKDQVLHVRVHHRGGACHACVEAGAKVWTFPENKN